MTYPNFSTYDTVFCDSLQALEWAYINGLPKTATVKSSSPSLLWNKKKNIHNIESRWTIKERGKFQSGIQDLSKNIFDYALNTTNEREIALTVSWATVDFQDILYKVASLEKEDFSESRLFIRVEGKCGPDGNMMNHPWEKILQSNPLFSTVKYTLQDDEWDTLSTHEISYWRRFKVAGYRTIFYRLAVKLMKYLPSSFFKREILMPNENELNIEIAASLLRYGVRITEIQQEDPISNKENKVLNMDAHTILCKNILPIMRKRVEEWVVPSAVESTMLLFSSHLEKHLEQFELMVEGWRGVITKTNKLSRAVLVNAPGNIKGYALSYVCRNSCIPVLSSQHGVTIEISRAHDMLHAIFDNNTVDAMFSYNYKITEVEKNTHCNNARHYVVGAPLRLINMKYARTNHGHQPSIVYISTNFYHMGFTGSQKTDYQRARTEQKLIKNVLSKLPHRVRYKTYPVDNRRNADIDPILSDINKAENIELFSKKLDMRYLISEHSIFLTTCATSTLGWPVMSGKPVVFINQKYNNPLTDEAYKSISRGIFVFNDDDEHFDKKLRDFLSQPIEEIERLWKEKKVARKEMLKEYFSTYNGGAGERSAKIILKEYLK